MKKLLRLALAACLLGFAFSAHAQSNIFNSVNLSLPGATPDYYNAPATPALHTVTSSANHVLASLLCVNTGAAITYIHFYSTTSVTIGTTSSQFVIPCGPTAASGFTWSPSIGLNLGGTAITYYVSGGGSLTDNTSITASVTYITAGFQ